MSDRIFQVASGAGVFGGAALFGLAAYVPLYVQGVHAGSATLSGASLTPMTFGWVAGSIVEDSHWENEEEIEAHVFPVHFSDTGDFQG